MAAAEKERTRSFEMLIKYAEVGRSGQCPWVGRSWGGCLGPAPWASGDSFAVFLSLAEVLCAAALALVASQKEIRLGWVISGGNLQAFNTL